MRPVLAPEELARLDAAAVAAGTPQRTLMERAGRAVAWRARALLGGTYGRRVVVACGKGSNGGDGRVAAAVLAGWGVRVEVVDVHAGAPPVDRGRFDRRLRDCDLLVDAVLGTGFRGVLEGDAAFVAERSADVATLAVDLPSGVDGATGAVRGPAVRAVATVTFTARKPGTCFEPGRSHTGAVTVAAIGVEVPGPWATVVVEPEDVAAWLPAADPGTNKWQRAVLVVGGSQGMTGAPTLAARSALRGGAGLVWCAVPGAPAAASVAGGEVIARALDATAQGALAGVPAAVAAALDRFQALVVGPGLGDAPETVATVRELVLGCDRPLVLDADGLGAFAGDPGALRARPAPTVLTPHAGEYERLVGAPVGDDRLAAARRLAAESGCVVVLKGPGTVVADPGGRAAVNVHDGPWLATAGTGDVLSGITGAFLARGLGAFEAAGAAVLVHGLAADRAGHTGLVAGDLVTALPRTLSRLAGETTTDRGPAADPERTT